MTVLPVQNGPEFTSATPVAAAALPAVQSPKTTPPRPTHRVTERVLVQAIAEWLAGAAWEHDGSAYRPYHGLNVRLRACGDQLIEDGVPVVSRFPSVLAELPEGTHTTNRTEARALCAIAVRGDAWRYR